MNAIQMILEECGWVFTRGKWACGNLRVTKVKLEAAIAAGKGNDVRENIIKKISNTRNPNLLATLERLKVKNRSHDQ